MDSTILLGQMIELFLVISLGALLFKLEITNVAVNAKITKLILDVTIPLLILSSVFSQTEERDPGKIIEVLIISILFYIILPILSFIVAKCMRVPVGQQGVYMFMHTFSNVGFMGFPVIEALYGEVGLTYAAVLNIIFNLAAYTLGVVMIHYKTGKKAENTLKTLLSPGIIGSVLALVFYFVPVTVPGPILGAISSVGGMTSTLAMLVIGGNLANIPFKKMITDKKVYLFTVLKQIIIPLLCWPLLKYGISDELVRGVIFILLLMPVGNTVVLFANKYEQDDELATRGVFITTVSSIVTIPLLLTLVG